MTLFATAYSAPPPPNMNGTYSGPRWGDEGYIMRHLEELRTRWSEAHNRWIKADLYYNRRFSVWPQNPDRPSLRPPTARNIVDHAVDTQIGHIPSVTRVPVGEGDVHRQDADRLEVGLKAVLENAQHAETVLPYKLLAKHLTLYGYGVLYGPTLSDPYQMMREEPKQDSYPDEEFRIRRRVWEHQRRNWNPIRIQAPHPTQVFLDPAEKDPTFGIYIKRIAAKDLKTHIEKRSLDVPKGPRDWLYQRADYEILDVLEYWTAETHTVMFQNGEILWKDVNTWGIVPFQHGFSGWGMDFSYGYETNQWSYAANMSVGILEPLYDFIDADAQGTSAYHTLLIAAAFSPLASKNPDGLLKAIAGGTMVQGVPEDHGVVKMVPDLDPTITQVSQKIEDDIQLTVPTRVLSGGHEPGVSTVGQTAIMSQAARRKYDTIAFQMQDMVSLAARKILHLIDTSRALEGRIGAAGNEITKKAIHGVYDCLVTFEVRDPVIDLQRRQLAMQEYGSGLIDKMTYLKQAGYENITEIRKGLLLDWIEKNPDVHQRLVMAVAREEGLEDLVASVTQGEIAGELEGSSALDSAFRPIAPTSEMSASAGAVGDAGLRQPLTGDTAKPQRIDLAR